MLALTIRGLTHFAGAAPLSVVCCYIGLQVYKLYLATNFGVPYDYQNYLLSRSDFFSSVTAGMVIALALVGLELGFSHVLKPYKAGSFSLFRLSVLATKTAMIALMLLVLLTLTSLHALDLHFNVSANHYIIPLATHAILWSMIFAVLSDYFGDHILDVSGLAVSWNELYRQNVSLGGWLLAQLYAVVIVSLVILLVFSIVAFLVTYVVPLFITAVASIFLAVALLCLGLIDGIYLARHNSLVGRRR